MNDINEVLEERGKRYGDYVEHAAVSQGIKELLYNALKYNKNVDLDTLDDDIKETLEMIAHKLGRIVNGDPYYADSYIDIAGYAKLVGDRLNDL